MNLMAIPGLSSWLLNFIKDTIAYWIVWPKKIVIPLASLPPSVMQSLYDTTPKGMFRVVLMEATGLQTSSAEVFCSLRRWDEQFEFLVSDPTTQSLDVTIRAASSLGQLEDLGECSIPISAFRAGVSVDRWLPLDVPLGSKAGGGELRLAMQWVPFQDGEGEDESDSRSLALEQQQQQQQQQTMAAADDHQHAESKYASQQGSLRQRTPFASESDTQYTPTQGAHARTMSSSSAPPMFAQPQQQPRLSISSIGGMKAPPSEDKEGQGSAPPQFGLETKTQTPTRARTDSDSDKHGHKRSLTSSIGSLFHWSKRVDIDSDAHAQHNRINGLSRTMTGLGPQAGGSNGNGDSKGNGGGNGAKAQLKRQHTDAHLGGFSTGAVMITVHSARALLAKDIGGTSDPFVVILGCNSEAKTTVVPRNINPSWEQDFQVFDFDRVTEDEFIGEVAFPLESVRRSPATFAAKTEYALGPCSAPTNPASANPTIQRGFITISLRFVPLARTKSDLSQLVAAAKDSTAQALGTGQGLRHAATFQAGGSAR